MALPITSIEEIRKKFPGSGKADVIQVEPEESFCLPSRVLAVNRLVGRGIPYGKIIEIYGEESSGKTLLALDFAAVTTSLGGVVLWNDAEQSYDREWADLNGVDNALVELYGETSIEKVADWWGAMAIAYRKKLTNNEPILFVCDSVAALDTEDNINSSQQESKAEMGSRAKALYTMFRRRAEMMAKLGVTSIFINQLRSRVASGFGAKYQDPDTTPGGKALKFYSSIRLGLYGGKAIKLKGDKGPIIGRLVTIRVKKNKVAPPRNSLKGVTMFNNADYKDPGFYKYSNLIETLLDSGVVTGAGGRYKDSEGNQLAYGEDNFKTLIEKNSEVRKNLLAAAGIHSVSKLRQQIEDEEINRYPTTNISITSKSKKKSSEEDETEDEE